MNDILRDIEKAQLKEHKVKFNPGGAVAAADGPYG